jgi:hypothetical protein
VLDSRSVISVLMLAGDHAGIISEAPLRDRERNDAQIGAPSSGSACAPTWGDRALICR